MERFGVLGKTLLGSDSHTCAAGSMGMLAMGAGGLEVALAMVGDPFFVKMPQIMGVKLTGHLPDWVSAKDVILEMLRRHGVKGGIGKIIEYHGPGLQHLSAMDRHVIANMGAELGATTTVFPSDDRIREFLTQQGRSGDWVELVADEGTKYDEYDAIDLSQLEPLIALPSSPGNVVPVREVTGRKIYQSMNGSSANPGLRDFSVAAMIVDGKQVHPEVSFDINPTSRQIQENLSVVIDKSFARIHWQNLVNFGILPLTFVDAGDFDHIEQGDRLVFEQLRETITSENQLVVRNATRFTIFTLEHGLSARQLDMVLAGSLISVIRARTIN